MDFATKILKQRFSTFFETEEDAQNNTNALPMNGYVNLENPQALYVRLDYKNTDENLEIATTTIEAVSCTGG